MALATTNHERSDRAERFDAAWPTVARRLLRQLRRRGATPDLADDVLQEVAVRAIERDVPFESAADLYPWCATVADRLLIDDHRQRTRRSITDLPDDLAATLDVPAHAEARTDLRTVTALVGELSVSDRELLLRSTGEQPRMTNREMIRRHRIRARLLAAIESILVVIGLRRRFDGVTRRAATATALAGLPVVLVTAALLLPAIDADGGARRGARPHPAAPARMPDDAWQRPASDRAVPTGAPLGGTTAPLLETVTPTPAGRVRIAIREGAESESLICMKGFEPAPDWCWGSSRWPTLLPAVPSTPVLP